MICIMFDFILVVRTIELMFIYSMFVIVSRHLKFIISNILEKNLNVCQRMSPPPTPPKEMTTFIKDKAQRIR